MRLLRRHLVARRYKTDPANLPTAAVRHRCVERAASFPLTLDRVDVRVKLLEVEAARRRVDRHFSSADRALHNATICTNLALEIEIAEVAGWSVCSRAWGAEARISCPFGALTSRGEVLCDHGVKV